jgi:hypothetical protein
VIGLQRCFATDYHDMCKVVVAEEAVKEEKRGDNGKNKLGS